MKTIAQKLAADLALDVLKEYHRGLPTIPNAVDREQAQARAFFIAEKHVRKAFEAGLEADYDMESDDGTITSYLDEPSKENEIE